MNRIAKLAFVVAVSMTAGQAYAADLTVAQIEQKIATSQSDFDNYNKRLDAEAAIAAGLEKELEQLRQDGSLADVDRQTALVDMNLQYERMVDDPSLDISASRQAYADAVNVHKTIKLSITDKYNEWQTKLQDVEQLKVSRHSLLNTLEGLKEQLNHARVDRLYQEFNKKDSAVVSHNIACDRDETINKCSERGKSLAKQKASKRFLDFLYDGLSESVEAERRRAHSDAHVQVLRSEVVESNFSGQGNFNVKMNVAMQGNLKRSEGCELLGLDRRYCLGTETLVAAEPEREKNAPVSTDESLMYELTVRSNVYDDEVFIDGVSYGSTRLEIMLPAGQHDVEVIKRGYESSRQSVNLDENTLLKVELERARYSFSKGEKIQDILGNDVPGPDLVVVPAGSFRMGDINATGLDNERPVKKRDISSSFGISETEITVADFQLFVTATSYVTDAEKDKGCASYKDGMAVYDSQRNWRAPGFNQTEQHPVVCVSVNDAKAYVQWLSKSSGQRYRLPSEVEWEYAARGGKESDFWWGEGVGADNGNCGWCGSQWSNASTAPVGSFERNDFGLFDTVGNVWEWSSSDSAGSHSLVRGGAWNFAPRLARVSTRMELDAEFRSNYIGFRVVREQ